MAQSTLKRPPAPVQKEQSGTKSTMGSILTLANWQLRQTWRLLSMIGLSLLVAVILVCAIPLYMQVSLSAGLRHTLGLNPSNLYLTVNAQSPLFSSNAVQQVQQEMSGTVNRNLGTTVVPTPALSVQMFVQQSATTFLKPIGSDVAHARSHVRLLQGRLPAVRSGDTIEFAASEADIHYLHLQLGKLFTLPYPLASTSALPGTPPLIEQVKFRLVGIVALTGGDDLFWHGETFAPEKYGQGLAQYEALPVLASNSEVMSVLTQLSQDAARQGSDVQFVNVPMIYWYYDLNLAHFDNNQLPTVSAGLTRTLTNLAGAPVVQPYVINTLATGPLSILQDYSARATVVQLPTSCLAYVIAGLVLFFVLLMTDVLVERQREAVMLLRSRGASARQVFGSLLGQCVAIALCAFLGGLLLAILGVFGLANLTLDASERGALNLISGNPLQVAQAQLARALLVVGIALLGTIVSIWSILRGNVLLLRRESARATRQPFWLRFKLDLVAALIALAGFGFSVYIASPGVLDVRTHALVLPLTSLVGVAALLVACLLLFLRIFPAILRLGERLAARRRGAAPVLALAQMARSPRQSLRMVLLLTLAVSFALFTLVFNQTQTQRLSDMATYQVGSDISGTIPEVLQGDTWENLEAFFRGIKGVTSTTLGTTITMYGGNSDAPLPLTLQAVDSSSYAQTVYWTAQDGSQSPGMLMAPLRNGQTRAEQQQIIPAIIDDAAAQSLGLSVGQRFSLHNGRFGGAFNEAMTAKVTAIVHYLPTIYDTGSGTGTDTTIPRGGILVDFQTFSAIEQAEYQDAISVNNVWLRTSSQPAALANVRANVFSGTYGLDNGEDRRELEQSLATDPLYGAVNGILVLGAVIALLLGLVGNLLVSWWNARSRRTSFTVLRALGCTPGQLAATLLWEQVIVYGAGLLFGVCLSIVCSFVILPAFIFSPLSGIGASVDAITSEAFYVAQSVPSVQPVFPILLIAGLLVGLIVICALALGLMLRVVTHSRIGQTLRVNED